ncbi:MAG TPA: transglycosylase SLT domain-containing protein [Candidatus Saccharimonadales bacterium]|nr:transglycosylase SLT domain-containing protein [Candidatus Saccharimonadales bacterium]
MNFPIRTILPTLLLSCFFISSCGPEKKPAATVPAPHATAPVLPPSSPAPATHTAPVHGPAAPPPAETVEQLIARAEAEYARGQANYTAGHMEAAKDNFDAAFNLLLRGPVGLQNDEKLQAEFDRIVEATHELELQALKAGDGFTEQRAEPAPIDEANNITFPVDPSIKAKAQAELANTHSDLPLMLTDPVASYINYFSSRGHGTIERALVRRGRYNDMISRVFREEHVPQDLVFLAQAESGFQPLALSRMGARGMWQFMPWDGTHAGLQHNWWVDERQDPEKSTRAAARLLRDLYNQFGDWYLAMAAYNSGPGTVQRAVQRTGYADFWELYKRNVLPGETRNYVPIILAMTIMAKNPTQYGLDHLSLDVPTLSDTVRIHYPIDLRLVAECTDSSTAVLQELNPSLLRMTTPKDMDFDLHVPHGTAAKFETAVAAIPEEMRVSWRYHRVESGETLTEIARRYRTTASAISEANNLETAELAKDTKLIIPVSPAKASNSEARAHATTVGYSKTAAHYTVHKGDTVLSVADDFGVPAEKVRQWNHLKGNALRSGRSLTIFKPSSSGATVKRTAEAGNRAHTRIRVAKSKSESGSHSTSSTVHHKKAKKDATEPAARKMEKEKEAVKPAPTRGKKHKQQG